MTVLGASTTRVRDPADRLSPIRSILYVVGMLLMMLGAVMMVPALLDVADRNAEWRGFFVSGASSIFFGGTLFFSNRTASFRLAARHGYLLTTLSWLSVSAFSALPYIAGETDLAPVDAFFEAMSGLTGTGATVISGLDSLPRGILLWRALTNWMGGIGIVVMAIVMLPFLRIGGMQLFRTESTERSDKPMARTSQLAAATALAYLALSVLCAIALFAGGMGWFDAICHAMATLATGGFSTKDASIGYFNSAVIQWIEVAFMTAGALPLVFFVRLATQGRRALGRDAQIRWFLTALAVAVVALTAWTWLVKGMAFGSAFTLSAFHVTSVMTDTGFWSTDIGGWGPFAVALLFLLYFVGGCAGSTAGSIKVFRWKILFATAVLQLRRMLEPNGVFVARYGGAPISDDVRESVRSFFFAYMLTFAVFTLVLSATGLDFLASAAVVAEAMANAGPALGSAAGPANGFAYLSDPAKWALALAMLLGRLELFTVYVLLVPRFWRW